MPELREPTMEPHDEEIGHVRGPSACRLTGNTGATRPTEIGREPANIQEAEIRMGKLA